MNSNVPFNEHSVKYILVAGGVCSSLGKGVTASSIGAVLRAYDKRVTAIKIDPYLNVDAGLMSPIEHGEVFVLDDGGEVDLDLGNYERTMDLHLTRDNNITMGKVFQTVLTRERKGGYLGKTVQMVPQVTDCIIDWIKRVARLPTDGSHELPEFCVIELGGTIGDLESLVFLEALRMLKARSGKGNFCTVLCSLVLHAGGLKTKPTQHTVRNISQYGLPPDVIACRCSTEVDEVARRKISDMCGVDYNAVVSVHDVPTLYAVPQLLDSQGIMDILGSVLQFDVTPPMSPKSQAHTFVHKIDDWERFTKVKTQKDIRTLNLVMVGKYTSTGDTYMSVYRAIDHAAVYAGVDVKVELLDSALFENQADEKFGPALKLLESSDGILVPGGFGERGIEGMIFATQWARENNKPYLGICLGMQIAILELARNKGGIAKATSEEFNQFGSESEHLLKFMPEVDKDVTGASMVLGVRRVHLDPSSLASQLYGGVNLIYERHRHRYEFNRKYTDVIHSGGMQFTGWNTSQDRMEVIEIPGNDFFFATQFHPEFKSRPGSPSPPFLGLVMAMQGKEDLRQGLLKIKEKGPAKHYTQQN